MIPALSIFFIFLAPLNSCSQPIAPPLPPFCNVARLVENVFMSPLTVNKSLFSLLELFCPCSLFCTSKLNMSTRIKRLGVYLCYVKMSLTHLTALEMKQSHSFNCVSKLHFTDMSVSLFRAKTIHEMISIMVWSFLSQIKHIDDTRYNIIFQKCYFSMFILWSKQCDDMNKY